MKTILDICNDLLRDEITIDDFMSIASSFNIYPNSINQKEGSIFFLAKVDEIKSLVVLNESSLLDEFEGKPILGDRGKICPLNNTNSKLIRKIFPFTSPVSHKGNPITIGLGDRLGLASPGHLRLAKKYRFFPVLAQQSIRELNLTRRTYLDVLDAASWAVFQEGYKEGYGADGDHLKTESEIQYALECGFTMLTLDCSDHIDNSVYGMEKTQVDERYMSISESLRKNLELRYLDKTFSINEELNITFDDFDFKKIVLIYLDTIEFTSKIYEKFISPLNDKIDFEISIDETLFTTSIEAHYFVASELIHRGVNITSLAPRFCGEFQKGIDYIGNKDEFEEEFNKHFLVSEYFGYKISVHSGSDKFSVFPIIGKQTKGLYHLKTAGTNWLEALRVIALKDSHLFRQIYEFAAKHLEEAKSYYHIKASSKDIISLTNISNENLSSLLDDENTRQILHITYGLILQAKDNEENFLYKDRIFKVLNLFEEDYYESLYNHIGRHLKNLGIKNI